MTNIKTYSVVVRTSGSRHVAVSGLSTRDAADRAAVAVISKVDGRRDHDATILVEVES